MVIVPYSKYTVSSPCLICLRLRLRLHYPTPYCVGYILNDLVAGTMLAPAKPHWSFPHLQFGEAQLRSK